MFYVNSTFHVEQQRDFNTHSAYSGVASPGLDTSKLVLATATALLVALTWIVTQAPGARWQMPLLVLVGALIGFVLYRATFGFSNAFRWLLDERNGPGIAVHAVMLAVTSLLFFPILSLARSVT